MDQVTTGPIERWRKSKRPINILSGTYGSPIHPIMVTIPIGAWLASLVFDVGSRVGGPEHILYVGSLWLMGIGIVGAFGAAATGFLDYLQLPAKSHVARIALVHMTLNSAVLVAYIVNFALRWAWQPGHGGLYRADRTVWHLLRGSRLVGPPG